MNNQIIVQVNPDVPPTGSDLGIVNAARKSFGRRSEWEPAGAVDDPYSSVKLKESDKRLLEFLARGMTANDFQELLSEVGRFGYNSYQGSDMDDSLLTELLWKFRNTPTHDTPFNHGFFSFEVKAPIFVARQLVKHEYLIMSEYSRRYITDDIEFYEPDVWRKKAEDIKQGSSSECVDLGSVSASLGDATDTLDTILEWHKEDCLSLYNNLIDANVAPEQARMVLPSSLMTSWTWSGTFGAFASMCKLRLASDSQYETRLVAQEIYKALEQQFPVSAPLIVKGVL